MREWEFELPLYGVVKQSKNNRNCAITFNWARAAHYRTYVNAKKKFKEMIREQIERHDPIDCKIRIHYTYYAKKNGTDLDNFVSVVKKFFQDAISEIGFIPDDKVSYIVKSSEEYGGLDRDNPRITAKIQEV